MKTRLKTANQVRVRIYPLLCAAVEAGVAYGYRRAHKYEDNPGEEHIKETIISAVTSELCELFVFDDDHE